MTLQLFFISALLRCCQPEVCLLNGDNEHFLEFGSSLRLRHVKDEKIIWEQKLNNGGATLSIPTIKLFSACNLHY